MGSARRCSPAIRPAPSGSPLRSPPACLLKQGDGETGRLLGSGPGQLPPISPSPFLPVGLARLGFLVALVAGCGTPPKSALEQGRLRAGVALSQKCEEATQNHLRPF